MKTIATVLLLTTLALAQAQSDEVHTRGMYDSRFRPARPGGAPAKAPAASQMSGAMVGVTLWRMRPSQPSDARSVRSLVHDATTGNEREMTPVRIASDTPLEKGQLVRLGIETERAGYLYVIDQEQYDKGVGDPYLIFPTMRLRGGNNRVKAGMVVELPSVEDDPPYFRVERTRPDQVSELITILISPAPIAQVKLGADRQKLSATEVGAWVKQWGARTYKKEAPAEVGKAKTDVEQDASAGKKELGPNDPAPQTYFRVDANASAPVLIQLPLRISK